MKSRVLLPSIVILALLLPLLAACGSTNQPASAPTQAPAAPTKAAAPAAPTAPAAQAAPTAAAKPAAPAETFSLKYGTWSPETIVFSKAQNWYLSEVEKRSNGRIKFERFWGESLVASKDIPDALNSGIIDLGVVNPSYYPGKFPLGNVGSLPAIGSDLYSGLRGYKETFEKLPVLQQEAAQLNIRFVAPAGAGPYYLLSKKEIKSVDEIKGLKIRALGLQADLVKALGASPVSIVAPETFEALSRGTIDAVATTASMATGYSLQDAAKFYSNIPFGSGIYYIGIRKQSWDKLPKDLQELMDKVALESIEAYARIYQIEGEGNELKKMVAAGVKTMTLPESETAKVVDVAKSTLWDKWVQEMEGKGLAGRQVLDTYVELANKAGKETPFKQ